MKESALPVLGGFFALIAIGGLIGTQLASCYRETMRWIANEQAFCASQGMTWESGNDKHNGSCIDAQGFAHPISDEVTFGKRRAS